MSNYGEVKETVDHLHRECNKYKEERKLLCRDLEIM